jgi:AAHS family 4-hydroxybenzoate transporter-like MFS transporter
LNQVIQIERLVDEQRFGRFGLQLLVLSFLAMFADGYDITAMAFAAPQLARLWHIPAADFGPVLSASLVGILFGAPALGWIGDRRGRRTAILIGLVCFGLSTLAVVWATSLTQVMVLRFVSGLGIGGLMPNTIALNSELAPKRYRATLIVLMFTGITLGSGTPGPVAAWLLPRYGWQVLFWIGGIVPLVVAALLYLRLPESVKYLARQPRRVEELRRMARAMRPEVVIAHDARFALAEVSEPGPAGIGKLFRGGFALITPLLWLCFVSALITNYFLNSWLPLIFERSGMPPEQAALASTLYHVGATVGGVLVSVLLDRFGFLAVAALFAVAVFAVAGIGWPGLGHGAVTAFAALSGLTVLGAQFGNNAASGLLYPPEFKSRGVGWALAVGRFGSIAGPLVGGVLIGLHLPLQQLFLAAALPLLCGVVAALLLARLCHARLGSLQLDDTPSSPAERSGTMQPLHTGEES